MVFGLFGGKKDKAAPKQQTPLPQDQELERQRKLVQMQKTLEEMKEKIDIGYKKLEDKQMRIKELIRQNKKTEAKRQLQVFKCLQDELAKQENMTIPTLTTFKTLLEKYPEHTKNGSTKTLLPSNEQSKGNKIPSLCCFIILIVSLPL